MCAENSQIFQPYLAVYLSENKGGKVRKIPGLVGEGVRVISVVNLTEKSLFRYLKVSFVQGLLVQRILDQNSCPLTYISRGELTKSLC